MPAIYNRGLNLMPLLEIYGKEKHSSSEGWVGEAQSRLNMSKGQWCAFENAVKDAIALCAVLIAFLLEAEECLTRVT